MATGEHLRGQQSIKAVIEARMLKAMLCHKDEKALQRQDADEATLVRCFGQEV